MTEIIKNSNESNIKLKKTMRLIKEIIVLVINIILLIGIGVLCVENILEIFK